LDYLEMIKKGFSWPAFLITLPWMLVKRLWGHAAFYVIACIVISRVTDVAEKSDSDILEWIGILGIVTLVMVPGVLGNKWLANKLKGLHFELLGTVQARSRRDAIAQAAKEFGGSYVEIYSTMNRAELMVVKSILDAEKIPYEAKGETSGLATTPFVLVVPVKDQERSLRLLGASEGTGTI